MNVYGPYMISSFFVIGHLYFSDLVANYTYYNETKLCAQNITNSSKLGQPMYNVIRWREKINKNEKQKFLPSTFMTKYVDSDDDCCDLQLLNWWDNSWPNPIAKVVMESGVPIIGTPTLIPLVKIRGAASHNAASNTGMHMVLKMPKFLSSS